MQKSKLSAFLSLALVFAAGGMVGAVGHRLYTVNTVNSGGASTIPPAPGKKMDPEEFRRRILADMTEKIKLNEEQTKQVGHIFDQTRDQFDRLRKTTDEKMKVERDAIWRSQVEQTKSVLNANQLPLYDKYRADREAERKKRGLRPPEHK